jgi:hypothetical protein
VQNACKLPYLPIGAFLKVSRDLLGLLHRRLPLLPPQMVREDRYPTSRLEAPYASFVLGTFPAAKQSMSPAEDEASADEDCILNCKECPSNAEVVLSVICTLN